MEMSKVLRGRGFLTKEGRLPKGLPALWNTWISTSTLTALALGQPVTNEHLEKIRVTPEQAIASVREQERKVREILPPSMVVYRGMWDSKARELVRRRPLTVSFNTVVSASELKEMARWFAKPLVKGAVGVVVGFRVKNRDIMSSYRTNPHISEWEAEVIVKPGVYPVESIEEVGMSKRFSALDG